MKAKNSSKKTNLPSNPASTSTKKNDGVSQPTEAVANAEPLKLENEVNNMLLY